MAKQAGASAATISRIWRSHGLKPHLSRTFKVSNDIRFEEKLTDIVGLYMNPPERAVVLCCDEKSQVQVLEVVIAGDGKKAEKLARPHIEQAADFMIKRLSRGPRG